MVAGKQQNVFKSSIETIKNYSDFKTGVCESHLSGLVKSILLKYATIFVMKSTLLVQATVK